MEDSYINRLIDKTQKKDDFEQELEVYDKIESKVENITKKYHSTRAELCKPKIYDITDKSYNYNQTIKTEMNKATDLRLGYLKDIDTILSSFFSESTNEKCFKDSLDSDINKTIQYFGEPKLLVGKISIKNKNNNSKVNEMKEKSLKDLDKSVIQFESVKNIVPLYLSEKALKILNKSFMS